ncbi:MAG: hypothetical protein NTX59_09850 [Elusimicrobia bacterium]|nr:hypothetical protein [Elusimicrobiota bacterium]
MVNNKLRAALEHFFESRIFIFCAAAAVFFMALWQLTRQTLCSIQSLYAYADRGELILHGLSDKALSYSMPFFSLLNALALYDWPGTIKPFILLAGFLVYLLCYSIGAAGGGPLRGLIFAFSAVLLGFTIKITEGEQLVYTLALLLYAHAATLKLKKDTALAATTAGLALGVSLLIRSPMFLFPLPVILWERFRGEHMSLRRYAVNSSLFLICAYILLMPWARVNYSLFGRLIPFEEARGACNLITGAKGTVFTMEGDCRAFGGLSRTESVYSWALKTVAASPFNYAEAVVKRLWQAALMFPLLLAAAIAALFFSRRRETRFLALLAGYFIVIHCLLSIEERYFYPLRYLLTLIIAAGIFDFLKAFWPGAERKDGGVFIFSGVFAVLIAFSFWVVYETVLWPGRASEPVIAVTRGLTIKPSDAWLFKKKGEILLSFNSTENGIAALTRYAELSKNPSPEIIYILDTLASKKPLPPDGLENGYDPALVKTLRELELNDMRSAAVSFTLAQGMWEREKNSLKGLPYEKDKRLAAGIRPSNNSFWEQDIYSTLYYFPLKRREAILNRLASLTALTPKLEYLKLQSALENGKKTRAALDRLSLELEKSLPSSEFNYNRQAGALLEALLKPASGCETKNIPALSAAAVRAVEISLSKNGIQNTINHFSPEPGKTGWREISLLYSAYEAEIAGQSPRAQAKTLAASNPDNLIFFYLAACGGKEPRGAQAPPFWPGKLGLTPSPISPAPADYSKRAGQAPPAFGKSIYPLTAAASVFLEDGQKDTALWLLQTANKAVVFDAGGAESAAITAQAAGDYRLALKLVKKGLAAYPGSPPLYNARGVLSRLSGKDPEAMADFKKAMTLDAHYFPAALNLASSLELTGDKPAALKLYLEQLAGASLTQEARHNATQAVLRLETR